MGDGCCWLAVSKGDARRSMVLEGGRELLKQRVYKIITAMMINNSSIRDVE